MSLVDLDPQIVDNSPDGLACPGWLLYLDDPDPGAVEFLGPPSPTVAAWFDERGHPQKVLDHLSESAGPPGGLLVLSADRRRDRLGKDLTALASYGAVVLDRSPSRSWRAALASAGLTTVRGPEAVQRWPMRPHRRNGPYVALGSRRTGSTGSMPAWLEDLVVTVLSDPASATWSLHVPSAYPSQKAVARIRSADGTEAVIVKLARHPRFNSRVENEARVLEHVAGLRHPVADRCPKPLALSRVAGLAAVVEGAVPGRPFLRQSALRAGCPVAEDATRAITELGIATKHPIPDPGFGEALHNLLARFADRHHPRASALAFLEDQVAVLAGADLPAVLFHGDLGTWNLMVDRGTVYILDWESAERSGPPLWDLFYFARSFVVRSGRRRGLDRDRAISRHLLGSSPISTVVATWVESYRRQLGLSPTVVRPLFYTCWMHRAVKESLRLAPSETGHYGPLALRMAEAHGASGLTRLLG